MAKKNNLVSETTMYSINPGTGTVVTHHLPWPRTSPQLQKYIERGFTFERPQGYELEPAPRQVEVKVEPKAVVVGEKEVSDAIGIVCPICGRPCKSDFGLRSHLRSHKKKEG